MLKLDLLNLSNSMVEIINKNEKMPREFGFALMRNVDTLTPIIKKIQEARQKAPDEYVEIDKKRLELIDKYAAPDEVSSGGQKIVRKNLGQFVSEFDSFINSKAEYLDIMKKVSEIEKEFNEFLMTEYSEKIEFYKISKKDFPDPCEPILFKNLQLIIKDE
jgi:hypothetical protein